MKYTKIESCIEKVYGYAVKRTYSREEADELAQEILFTAVRELPGLRDESRFEPLKLCPMRMHISMNRKNSTIP